MLADWTGEVTTIVIKKSFEIFLVKTMHGHQTGAEQAERCKVMLHRVNRVDSLASIRCVGEFPMLRHNDVHVAAWQQGDSTN
jgi:hypothetical protein